MGIGGGRRIMSFPLWYFKSQPVGFFTTNSSLPGRGKELHVGPVTAYPFKDDAYSLPSCASQSSGNHVKANISWQNKFKLLAQSVTLHGSEDLIPPLCTQMYIIAKLPSAAKWNREVCFLYFFLVNLVPFRSAKFKEQRLMFSEGSVVSGVANVL